MKSNELTTTTNPAAGQLKKLPLKGIKKYYHSEIKTFNTWLEGREIGPDALTEFFDFIQGPYIKSYQKDKRTGEKTPVVGKRSASTLQKYRGALQSAVLKHFKKSITLAQLAELKEFFKNIDIKKRGTHNINKSESLTKKELAQLEKKAGPKTSLLVTTLYETAARVSEMLSIMIADCKIENDYVLITIQKDKRGQEKKTAITLELFNEIRAAYPGELFLFQGPAGKPLRAETAYKMIKAAGRQVNKNISPHTLRHSKATNMLDDGISVDRVAAHLGNKPATCIQFYCHNDMSPAEIVKYNRSRKAADNG